MFHSRSYHNIVLWALLAFPTTMYGQSYSCTMDLPYVQNFNSFSYQTPWASSAVDMTLVTEDNCWTQYIYRSLYTVRSMIAPNHTGIGDHSIDLFAHHPMAGQPDRISYTYMVSPSFNELPTIISFDVQYCWFNSTGSDGIPDGLSWHAGILQLGYVTDENDPAGNYFPIANIVIDTAAWFSGNIADTNHWQHYRLDLRTHYSTLPTIRRLAFRPNCNMDSLDLVHIYIDNLRVANEMDTIDYCDTVCLGQPYNGFGFTVDSLTAAGIHTYGREVLENHGMVHYRLRLFVPDPVVTHLYNTIAVGDTLSFADTLLTTEGTYTFVYPSANGCDSTVILRLTVYTPHTPEALPCEVWFPNVFTPGLDNNNRFGCVTNAQVTEFEMYIYHRWGQLVYSTRDIHDWWNGGGLPQGAYVYYYRLRTAADNRVHSGKGTVTLLR